MTTIKPDQPLVTLINTLDVDPARQQELLDLLIEATTDVMRHLDGFISANLHKSLDGRQLTNYAQWKSKAHFASMLSNEEAKVHMDKATGIASKITPILYEVVTSEGAPLA